MATMTQSVTGIFADRGAAETATHSLVAAGFRRDQIHILDARNLGRRSWIARRIVDTKRAVLLGLFVGGAGGAIAGMLLGSNGTAVLTATALGCGVAALGGALLGTVVGRSTSSQIQSELEHEVDAGKVLVSVTTDEAHAALLGSILAREGHSCVVSSTTSFRAAILPSAST